MLSAENASKDKAQGKKWRAMSKMTASCALLSLTKKKD